jgi:hypothetical protein
MSTRAPAPAPATPAPTPAPCPTATARRLAAGVGVGTPAAAPRVAPIVHVRARVWMRVGWGAGRLRCPTLCLCGPLRPGPPSGQPSWQQGTQGPLVGVLVRQVQCPEHVCLAGAGHEAVGVVQETPVTQLHAPVCEGAVKDSKGPTPSGGTRTNHTCTHAHAHTIQAAGR